MGKQHITEEFKPRSTALPGFLTRTLCAAWIAGSSCLAAAQDAATPPPQPAAASPLQNELRASSRDARTAGLLKQAFALEQEQRFPDAIERYQQILRWEPNNLHLVSPVSLAIAVCYAQLKRFADQTNWAAKAVAAAPGSAHAHAALGNGYIGLGQLDHAAKEFARINELAPNAPDGYFGQGEIAEARGNSQEAVELYRKALDLDPSFAPAELRLELIANPSSPPPAPAVAQDAVNPPPSEAASLPPPPPPPLQEASPAATPMPAIPPPPPPAAASAPPSRVASLQSAPSHPAGPIQLPPPSAAFAVHDELKASTRDVRTTTLLKQAFGLEEEKRFADAIERYQQILRWEPNNLRIVAPISIAIAGCYGQMMRFAEQVDWATRAVTAAPGNAHSHLALGDGYLAQGELERAPKEFEKVIELAPMAPDGYFGQGLIAERQGNLENAEQLFRKGVEVDPAFTSGHLKLAALATDRKDYAQAVQELRRVLEITPQQQDALQLWKRIQGEVAAKR